MKIPKMKKFKNYEKIKILKAVEADGMKAAMEKFGIKTDTTINTWRHQYEAGLFKGREHLVTIPFDRQKKEKKTAIQTAPVAADSNWRVEELKKENQRLREALRKVLGVDF